MKNLVSKIILPLVLASGLSFNSKAQDFLPGKFRNYESKKVLLLRGYRVADKGIYVEDSYYDIDNDSLIDVVESTLFKVQDGKIVFDNFPTGYSLRFDPTAENFTQFYDPSRDGWNENEVLYKREKHYTVESSL